jgi:hypothetical protein
LATSAGTHTLIRAVSGLLVLVLVRCFFMVGDTILLNKI